MEPVVKGQTTLAVILGAKAFPKSEKLSAPPSFERSALRFRDYLLEQFSLPPDNLKDLFDTSMSPDDILEDVESFVKARKAAVNAQDLFFYYVGHGGTAFRAGSSQFYIATRTTRVNAETSSSIVTSDLALALRRSGGGLRYYVILDCCFSAAAYSDFQAPPLQLATQQTAEAFPQRGTLLFYAASKRDVALAPEGEDYTRFTSAMLTALKEGDPQADEYLSFADLGRQVEAILQQRHPDKWTRPDISAPDARQGDLANLPAFLNRAYRRETAQAEYYIRFVRRDGIPEGIGPISEGQARQRGRCVRVSRERQRVRRLETINGAGFLTPDIYGAEYLKGTRGSDQAAATCRWQFSYDEAGRVAMEEMSNASGRVVNRCAYSTAGAAGRGAFAHYFLTASEVAHPQTKSGAAFVRISRDDAGFDRRLEYFDGAERRQPDELGSFGREIEVDARGLEVRVTQLGFDLKPAICKDGYAIAKRAYDDNGNLLRESCFDAEDMPVFHREGYHSAAFDWGPKGNWVGVRLFDVEDKPTLAKSGFSSWTAEYDSRGNLIRQAYYDAADKPVEINEGFAAWTADYDERGRIIAQRYFDPEGRPSPSKEGVVEMIVTRNDEERREDVQFRGADGRPKVNRSNIAQMTRRYDEQQNVIEELYFDADGKLARNTEGYAGAQMTADPAGNQTEFVFLGTDQTPSWNNEGIARISKSYDTRGNLTSESYFGPDGSPAEDEKGRHRIAYAYDAHSNRSAVAYFNAAGQPALKDGYASEAMQFDPGAGVMIRREFHDAGGNLTRKTAGHAIEAYDYDRFGRQVRLQCRDVDEAPIQTAQGHAAWTADYDARGNRMRQTFLGVDGAPAASADGYASWSAKRDPRGNPIAMRYFDSDGRPAVNLDAVAGWDAVYDSRDNQVGIAYVAPTGERGRRKEGFAAWTAHYDALGNRIEERYFDAEGAPAPDNEGVARRSWTYNHLQKRTSEQCRDASDLPIATKQGYAGWAAAYDDRGKVIEQMYFGLDGQPTTTAEGYSRIETDYDDRGRMVERRWTGGATSPRTKVSYPTGGGRVETWIGIDEKIVLTFDRAGRQTEEAYFSLDGARTAHLERSLSFSFWQKEYDVHGRMLEQRYYDPDGKMFRRLRKRFDPIGTEIETSVDELHDERREFVRTRRTAEGSEIETSLTDAAQTPVTDRFGRSRWTERYDRAGNRLEARYFGPDGGPVAYQGHFGCSATYDRTNRLSEATYEIVRGTDETSIKRFRFAPEQRRAIHFQSIVNDVQTENDAYVLEYLMAQGDRADYIAKIRTESDAAPATELEIRMTQHCRDVDSAGRYNIIVDSVVPRRDAGDDARFQIEMLMKRTGEVVQSTAPTDSPNIPFPTHPIFMGESWKRESMLPFENPYTGQKDNFPLEYTYRLAEVTTAEHQPVAQIDVTCPLSEVGVARDFSFTISARGVTLFDIRRGLLLGSRVETLNVMKLGAERVTTRIMVLVALQPG
jgi:eukaryotic-like serine/threonine-protein kinase